MPADKAIFELFRIIEDRDYKSGSIDLKDSQGLKELRNQVNQSAIIAAEALEELDKCRRALALAGQQLANKPK